MRNVSTICLAVVLLAGCGKPEPLRITDVWIRETPPGRTVTAAFMRIENLEDHFEHHRSLSVQYVDLDKLSAHFTRKIYHSITAPAGFNIQIDEMSLTGN